MCCHRAAGLFVLAQSSRVFFYHTEQQGFFVLAWFFVLAQSSQVLESA